MTMMFKVVLGVPLIVVVLSVVLSRFFVMNPPAAGRLLFKNDTTWIVSFDFLTDLSVYNMSCKLITIFVHLLIYVIIICKVDKE